MLFSFELTPAAMSEIPEAELKAALVELLRARRMGFHLVVFDRESANYIICNIKMNDEDLAIMRRVMNDYTQIHGLKSVLKTYIKIVYGPPSTIRRIADRFEVSLDCLYRFGFLSSTILLTENLHTDGKIISYILQEYARRSNFFPLSFELANGGGEAINHNFSHHLEQNRICVCVIDSDYDSPIDNCKIKERKCRSIFESLRSCIGCMVVLPCREIENMMPLEVFDLVFPGVRLRNIILKIETEESRCNEATIPYKYYVDLKYGIRHERINGLAHEHSVSWIEQKLNLAGFDHRTIYEVGYGEHIIQNILASNAALNQINKSIQSHAWRQHFGSIMLEIISWIVGGSKLRT